MADDSQYFVDNYLVRNPSRASAARFLKEVLAPSTVDGYYQPLTMISLMVDCAMGARPDNLAPLHQTSLILHTANTALLIVLLYLLFGNACVAAMVGLLFGLHPMTVEPICWVAERKTMLAGFFALWSLLSYVRYAKMGQWRWYGLALVAFIFALMAKPTATPLPLLLLLLDFWPLRRLNRRAVPEKIPFFVLVSLSAVITFISQRTTAGVYNPAESSLLRIPLTLCHNLVFYPWKMIWPAGLSSHYPVPEPMSLSHPMVLAGVIGTVILIPLLLISLRWTRGLLTGWLFFFLAILPTMGIIGFTNVIAADKYAYLPALGLLMILASLLNRLWSKPSPRVVGLARRLGIVFIVLVLCGLESLATRRYLTSWRDSETRLRYMLSLTPGVPYMHDQLATMLSDRGNLSGAIAEYSEALRLEPAIPEIHCNLAIALAAAGRSGDALAHYIEALRLKPNSPKTHYDLANLLASQGNLDEAIRHYTEALWLKPKYPEAHSNLASALAAQGKTDEAIAHYAEALRLWPSNAETHGNLGNALCIRGRLDDAIWHYTEALRLKPDFAEGHNNLAFALAKQGKLDKAIPHYREALRLMPTYIQAHNNLAAALASQGELEEALRHYRAAIELNPTSVTAHRASAAIMERQGRIDAAIREYQEALRLKPQDGELRDRLEDLLGRQSQSLPP